MRKRPAATTRSETQQRPRKIATADLWTGPIKGLIEAIGISGIANPVPIVNGATDLKVAEIEDRVMTETTGIDSATVIVIPAMTETIAAAATETVDVNPFPTIGMPFKRSRPRLEKLLLPNLIPPAPLLT